MACRCANRVSGDFYEMADGLAGGWGGGSQVAGALIEAQYNKMKRKQNKKNTYLLLTKNTKQQTNSRHDIAAVVGGP